MTIFNIYQQMDPIRVGRDGNEDIFAAHLFRCGSVEAKDEDAALAIARTWSRFTLFRKCKLAGFPMVERDEPLPMRYDEDAP